MFDAVQHQEPVRAGRVGLGGALAIGLHACAILVILRYGTCEPKEARGTTDIVFKQALPLPPPPPPPPPPAGGAGAKPQVEQPKKPTPVKKPDTIVESKKKEEPEKPKDKPKEPEKPSEAAGEPSGKVGGKQGGEIGGDLGGELGGKLGGQLGGVLGNPLPSAQPTNITLPFGEGMTPPSLAAGSSQPQYTREALEAKVEGKVIARCTITVAGTLTDCRILKGLPFLDQAVLATLAGQKYTPVMYQGHAQSVFYTLTFRFKLP